MCLVCHPPLSSSAPDADFVIVLLDFPDEIRCIHDNRRAICMRQPPMHCRLLYITGASRPHFAARSTLPKNLAAGKRSELPLPRGRDTWVFFHVDPRCLTPAELLSPSLAVALGACSPE